MIQSELSAEARLGLTDGELDRKWTVRARGLFYRNYSEDIMSVDNDTGTVYLSRDGWLRYLPDELISPTDEILKQKNVSGRKKLSVTAADEMIRRRLLLLAESMVPFDSFTLRIRLVLERKIQEILSDKVSHVLRKYFDFDMDTQTDEYVRKAAMLLPYISRIRGNVGFVRHLLEVLTGHRVTMEYSYFGGRDNTVCSTRKVTLNLQIDGLDEDGYQKEIRRIRPVVGFIEERFLPFSLMCSVGIQGRSRGVRLLDYNYTL